MSVVISNLPDLVLEVTVTTGKKGGRGQRRVYHCQSWAWRPDARAKYEAGEKAELEKLIIWQITQVSPPAERIGAWERVNQCRIAIEGIEIRWVLERVLREQFSKHAKLNFDWCVC